MNINKPPCKAACLFGCARLPRSYEMRLSGSLWAVPAGGESARSRVAPDICLTSQLAPVTVFQN